MEPKKPVPPAVDFEPYFLDDLKDPEFAAGFLNVALEEYSLDGDIKSFNGAIKYVLKAQNITQMAKDIGISKQHIHRIINGQTRPTFDLLIKLFKYLGYQFKVEPIDRSA